MGRVLAIVGSSESNHSRVPVPQRLQGAGGDNQCPPTAGGQGATRYVSAMEARRS
jgi:hypothetical protein